MTIVNQKMAVQMRTRRRLVKCGLENDFVSSKGQITMHPLAVQIVTTNSSHTFRGFQVAVHRVLGSNNSQELLGTFSTNDNTTQLVTCVGEPKVCTVEIRNQKEPGQITSPHQNILTVFGATIVTVSDATVVTAPDGTIVTLSDDTVVTAADTKKFYQ